MCNNIILFVGISWLIFNTKWSMYLLKSGLEGVRCYPAGRRNQSRSLGPGLDFDTVPLRSRV